MTAQIIATRPALLVALLALVVATLVACDGKGVDVAVVGIPDGATVSVDALPWDTAAAPSRVYRYAGVGYARLLGLAVAPSYSATARRGDGCSVAVGSVEYSGEDEVRIDLHAVDGCGKPATPVEPQPIAPTPTPQPSPMPQPQPMPMPMQQPLDSDKDGVPDASDLCPLLVGSANNTPRPGCPLPRTATAQLVPMAKGGTQTANGYDFAASTSPQFLDFLIILPVEAATARQVVVDYSLSAKAAWAPSSDFCAKQGLPNRHLVGAGAPGTQNTCIPIAYRAGLSSLSLSPGEFIVESPRPAGDAPAQISATRPQSQVGVVDARQQNTLRLMLSGTLSLSMIATSASVTLVW